MSYLHLPLWYLNLQFPNTFPYEILWVLIVSRTYLHVELSVRQIVVLTTDATCVAPRDLNLPTRCLKNSVAATQYNLRKAICGMFAVCSENHAKHTNEQYSRIQSKLL
jgi:hypothetical protein